ALPPTDPDRQAAAGDDPPPPWAVAVTRRGRCVRFDPAAHSEISTRNGRRYMKPEGGGDGVVAVHLSQGNEHVCLATVQGRALCFPVDQISFAKGAAKGVTAIKLVADDRVLAFELSADRMGGAVVETRQGRREVIRPNKYAANRAGRGRVVLKRDPFVRWCRDTVRYDERYGRAANGEPRQEPLVDAPADLEE
ncbi:MAG: hypothetical protein D6798_02195, partial [Deltaproteobacteria bacterium]